MPITEVFYHFFSVMSMNFIKIKIKNKSILYTYLLNYDIIFLWYIKNLRNNIFYVLIIIIFNI